jgi:hypothetical protein
MQKSKLRGVRHETTEEYHGTMMASTSSREETHDEDNDNAMAVKRKIRHAGADAQSSSTTSNNCTTADE